MTARTQRLLVLGLGGCWMAIAFLRWMGEAEPQQVPLRFRSGQRPEAVSGLPVPAAEFQVRPRRAQVEDLPVTPRRNMFLSAETVQLVAAAEKRRSVRPRTPTAPIVAPPVAAVAAPSPSPAPPQPSAEELAALAERQRHEQIIRQLREQMGQYRYLGYLTQDGQLRAFLGKGNEIHILRQGDMLEGKFLVAMIEATTITLREGQNNLEARLELKKDPSIGPS